MHHILFNNKYFVVIINKYDDDAGSIYIIVSLTYLLEFSKRSGKDETCLSVCQSRRP